ncbi:unnamed protein product [Phaeothamnion confervicola]
MAMAGALAGALATGLLHPLDTAKTLRQAHPHQFCNTRAALLHLFRGPIGLRAAYAGAGAAVLGAMPSSALYFGAYEAMKGRLTGLAARRWVVADPTDGKRSLPPQVRAAVHMLSAACGNAASSAIFVPKEFIKQTLQNRQSSAETAKAATGGALRLIRTTIARQGVRGVYRGYWATMSRNVPSAVLKFFVFEELKLLPLARSSPSLLLAGAVAGAVASGLTTPLDVVKTQVAIGMLDRGLGVPRSLAKIAAEDGVAGLFAGVQPRVAMSALFTAIGFGSFEFFKDALGVGGAHPLEGMSPASGGGGGGGDSRPRRGPR